MKQSLLTLGAAFALAGASQAAILIDNFESYPADNTTSMNGLGTWTVNNGTAGLNEIAITTDNTFELSSGAALIGGWTPDNPGTTTLSSAPNVAMVGNANYPAAMFKMDFGFYDSTDANRDNYSISLDSTNGNLLTINLAPAVNVNTFDITFSSDFFAFAGTFGLDALDTLGAPYSSIEFQTWTDGLGGMFYNLKNFNTLLSTGTLSGNGITTGDFITGLDISVDTTGGAGDGYLIIDNVSVIPEPSSALLGLLGAAFAFTRRRRA